MKIGITTRVAVSSFAIVLLTVGAAMFVALSSTLGSLRQSIGKDLQDLAATTAAEIDKIVAGSMTELRILSRADVFEQEDPEAMGRYLSEAVRVSPSFSRLVVLDLRGRILASSEAGRLGERPLAEDSVATELFRRLVMGRQGEVFFRDVHPVDEDVELLLMTPITDEQNVLVIRGLLASLSLDELRQRVAEIDRSTIGRKAAYLVNRRGEVIFTLDPDAVPFLPLPDAAVSPGLRQLLGGEKEGFLRYVDHAGDPVLAAYADLAEYGVNRGGDWSLISVAPEAELLAPVTALRNRLLVVGLGALLLAALLTGLAARRAIAPLGRLTRATRELRDGARETRVRIERHDEIGQLAGAFNAMARTLETQRSTLREATAERERFAAVLREARDLVAIADPQGHLLYLNRAGRRLLEIGEEESLDGVRARDHYTESARRLIAVHGLPAALRDGVWSGETMIRSRRGEEIPVWQTLIAQRDQAGELAYTSAIARDLRERKRLHDELLRAQRNEAVGELSRAIARDFDNLITAVVGYADLALSSVPPSSPLRADLKEIRRAGRQAAALAAQLLAFASRQGDAPRLADPNRVILDLGPVLRRLLGGGIELLILPEEGLGPVAIDPARLEQVIVNLTLRAREAMPTGGRLVVETKKVALDEQSASGAADVPSSPHVLVAVRDTGEAMNEDELAHIFDPFPGGAGPRWESGPPLSTSHAIVAQAGGHMLAYSLPGEGSSFEIYLPVSDVEADARSAADLGEPHASDRETILVSEEES